MDELFDAVHQAIERDRPMMIALLSELVAIPTENPPGRAYDLCADTLERAATSLGFACERVAFDEGRTVLVATDAPPQPTLYFHGHYDVVPAAPEQFVPRIDGDTMFGRGTSDMKSGLVAMLFAAKAVRELGLATAGRIALVLVPDEETGGRGGSAALAEAGRLGVDGVGMILPEPTSGVVWNASRGAISIRVTVRGRAAHVGLAHTGVNAFEQSLPLLNDLMEQKAQLPRDSVLLIGGRVEAGTNFNVVPASCQFTIDRRFGADENLYEVRLRLLEAFERARARGLDFDIEVIQEGRAASTSPDDPFAVAVADSIAEVTGRSATFEPCPGLLETRFYADAGVPALAYGPGVLAVSHGPQEFVRLGRMAECAKVLAHTAARVIGSRTAARGRPRPGTVRLG